MDSMAQAVRVCHSPKLDRSEVVDFSTAWKEESGRHARLLFEALSNGL
jgi:hypothetical protein